MSEFLTISELLYLNEYLCIVEQEWMSDSLSKGFYNGKPNPFEVRTLCLTVRALNFLSFSSSHYFPTFTRFVIQISPHFTSASTYLVLTHYLVPPLLIFYISLTSLIEIYISYTPHSPTLLIQFYLLLPPRTLPLACTRTFGHIRTGTGTIIPRT
jgi:hypothetical protein